MNRETKAIWVIDKKVDNMEEKETWMKIQQINRF